MAGSSSAAVKRIMRELRELATTSNPDIAAVACEDSLFEWVFAIRGAWDSEFAGGIYVGRIHMPAEYPFKPPGFTMLTPSGRFEINTKICLSISSYHPESWQPSWSVESALVALIAFMQTEGGGAIGSLDCPKEDREAMAAESRVRPPRVKEAAMQELVDALWKKLVGAEEESRRVSGGCGAATSRENENDNENDNENENENDNENDDENDTEGRGEEDEADAEGVVAVVDAGERVVGSAEEVEVAAAEETATISTTATPATTATPTTTTILMTSVITIFVLWHVASRLYARRAAADELDAGLSYTYTSPDIIEEMAMEMRDTREL